MIPLGFGDWGKFSPHTQLCREGSKCKKIQKETLSTVWEETLLRDQVFCLRPPWTDLAWLKELG